MISLVHEDKQQSSGCIIQRDWYRVWFFIDKRITNFTYPKIFNSSV